MTTSTTNRFRPSIGALEHRDAPSGLTSPSLAWLDPGAPPFIAAHAAESAAANSQERPFHLEESGSAVFASETTLSASASGRATHLGAFTLHDTSTIIGSEVIAGELILFIEGDADLEAANSDHLYAHFTGSINFTAGTGTLNFEWTGGSTGGRFVDATGVTVWQVSVNQDLTYTATADGVIRY